MDLSTFQQAVAAMTAFTDDVRDAALTAGQKMDDADRDALVAQLTPLHGECQELEDKRVTNYEEAIRELNDIAKKDIPVIRKVAEEETSASDKGSLGSIEDQMKNS